MFEQPEEECALHSRPTRIVDIPFPTDCVESVKPETEYLVAIHERESECTSF